MLHLSTTTLSLAPTAAPQHWRRFVDLHAGDWRGQWSTLGPDGTLLEQMTAAQRLEVVADEDRAVQTLVFVTGAVRSDCETCFDSEETKEIPAGSFSPDTLPYRVAGPGSAFGPRVLRSGALTFEACARHDDERVRLTARYHPQSLTASTLDGTPTTLTLGKVTVARESLCGRAVPSGSAPTSGLEGEWAGQRFLLEEPSPKAAPAVEAVRCDGGALSPAAGECKTLLDAGGGVAAVLPSRIFAAEPAELLLSWRPEDGTLLQLRASVEALGRRVVSTEQTTVMAPPRLLSLAVSEMRRDA